MYAMQVVLAREIPAAQCTTTPPSLRPSWIKSAISAKSGERSCLA